MCVLVVEDEALVRDILVEALSSYGHDVCEASTGDAAAVLIETPPKTFTLLITDIHMPGQRDGIEVARLMRQHCRRKIEMSPGVQSRDDTSVSGHSLRETASQPNAR
jgi:CheY-like chemotaxis protein